MRFGLLNGSGQVRRITRGAFLRRGSVCGRAVEFEELMSSKEHYRSDNEEYQSEELGYLHSANVQAVRAHPLDEHTSQTVPREIRAEYLAVEFFLFVKNVKLLLFFI